MFPYLSLALYDGNSCWTPKGLRVPVNDVARRWIDPLIDIWR